MTNEEFNVYLSSALNELWEKQDSLELEYGLSTFSCWRYEQTMEILEFYNVDDTKILKTNFIDIGSYAPEDGTWMWGWNNESILPNLRKQAEAIKELGTITGMQLFTEETPFPIDDESMAWELAALSVKQLGAMGVYRAPSSTKPLYSFLALMNIMKIQ